MIHKLIPQKRYFQAVWDKKMNFVCCKNDRRFEIGDTLVLVEYDINEPTSRHITALANYILFDDHEGLKVGYVIMGMNIIKRIDKR